MGANIFNYCAVCGHHIDRHRHISIHKGAPCAAPLGNGHTCTCKGFVSPDRPEDKKARAKKDDDDLPPPELVDDTIEGGIGQENTRLGETDLGKEED